MSVLRRLTLQHQKLLLALAALALLLRAAVPVGWMPTFGGNAIAISVCSGEGRATMWLDKSGQVHKSDPGQQEHSDNPCAFAFAPVAVDMPDADAPLLIRPSHSAMLAANAHTSPGRGLAAPPPPQTGPPTLI